MPDLHCQNVESAYMEPCTYGIYSMYYTHIYILFLPIARSSQENMNLAQMHTVVPFVVIYSPRKINEQVSSNAYGQHLGSVPLNWIEFNKKRA
jgi:hypothetical protein